MLISVDVPDEMKRQLDAVKARTGMSLSLMVRGMIEAHLAAGEPVQFLLTDPGKV